MPVFLFRGQCGPWYTVLLPLTEAFVMLVFLVYPTVCCSPTGSVFPRQLFPWECLLVTSGFTSIVAGGLLPEQQQGGGSTQPPYDRPVSPQMFS